MDNTIAAELILGGIILILIVGHFLYVRETNKEKTKLVNALISRSATELRDLELTEKVKPIVPPIPLEPSFVPEADLTDEEFMERIEKEGNG